MGARVLTPISHPPWLRSWVRDTRIVKMAGFWIPESGYRILDSGYRMIRQAISNARVPEVIQGRGGE